MEFSSNWVFHPKYALGEMLSYKTEFASHFHVCRIEVSSTWNHESTDGLVVFRYADQIDRHRSATRHHNFHWQFSDPGGLDHLRKAGFHGVNVADGHFVAQRPG